MGKPWLPSLLHQASLRIATSSSPLHALLKRNNSSQPVKKYRWPFHLPEREVITQGATLQKLAQRWLQVILAECLSRIFFLHVHLQSLKTEFVHFIPHTTNRTTKDNNTETINIYGPHIPPTNSKHILGGTIDKIHSFKKLVTGVSIKVRGKSRHMWAIASTKGAAPGTLHDLIHSIALEGFLWGREVC